MSALDMPPQREMTREGLVATITSLRSQLSEAKAELEAARAEVEKLKGERDIAYAKGRADEKYDTEHPF